jgi:hypothetical protein
MSIIQPERLVLADLVDLADPDSAIETLSEASEPEFDLAVRAYLRGGTVGAEVMRDEDLADRTFAALDRLAIRYGRIASQQQEPQRTNSLRVLEQIRRERRALYPLVQEIPEVMGLAMLSDVIPLDDVDAAVDRLLDMDEAEFDRTVLLWLLGGREGAEIMREPDIIERTFDALNRLRDRVEHPQLAAQLGLPPDELERLDRIVREERASVRSEMHRVRAEKHSGGDLNARAYRTFAKENLTAFLAVKRRLREEDAAARVQNG